MRAWVKGTGYEDLGTRACYKGLVRGPGYEGLGMNSISMVYTVLGLRMHMMPRAAPSAMQEWGAQHRCQALLI